MMTGTVMTVRNVLLSLDSGATQLIPNFGRGAATAGHGQRGAEEEEVGFHTKFRVLYLNLTMVNHAVYEFLGIGLRRWDFAAG